MPRLRSLGTCRALGISIALAIHSFDGRDLEIAPTIEWRKVGYGTWSVPTTFFSEQFRRSFVQ